MQPGLFDEPEAAVIPLPRAAARPAKAKVKYENVTLQQDCNDCEQHVYETLREAGTTGHQIRRARVRRTEGKEKLLLCVAHANARRELESQTARKQA